MTFIVILLIINIFRDKDAGTRVATMGIQDVILVTFGIKGYSTSNPHVNLSYFYGKCYIDLAVQYDIRDAIYNGVSMVVVDTLSIYAT